jgi:hypothetical protein
MAKKRIQIVGDSFCAANDYDQSWHNRLSDHFDVTNFSQCGVGQYKIHQQLYGSQNIFDIIIYSVSSPFRCHTESNPFYSTSHPTHSNCDFIYQDVVDKLPDHRAKNLVWWFENVFDLDQAKYMHNLLVVDDCKIHNVIPISFFDYTHIDRSVDIIDFFPVWKNHPGFWNHLDDQGHNIVFQKLMSKISFFLEKNV